MGKPEKERRIVRAAERLFTRRRFHEVKMDDVSRVAGVGKGTIYRYFKDKDDLFLRVVMSGFEELCGLLEETASEDLPFREQLTGVVSHICDFFVRRRPLMRVMQSEHARLAAAKGAMRGAWTRRRGKVTRVVSEVVRRGVARGEVRRDIPADALAAYLLSMLRGRVRRDRAARSRRRIAAEVIEVFLRGAEARS